MTQWTKFLHLLPKYDSSEEPTVDPAERDIDKDNEYDSFYQK